MEPGPDQGAKATWPHEQMTVENIVSIGDTWFVDLSDGPANTNCWLGIAPSPLTVPGQFIGGCQLWALGVAYVPDTTNTAGKATWAIPVPDDLRLYQAHLYTQAIMVDLFANPGGVVTSNGDDVMLGTHPSSAIIFRRGDANASNGFVNTRWGQIAMFDWQ